MSNRNLIVVIVCILLLSVGCTAYLYLKPVQETSQQKVVITVDGAEYAVYPLNVDRVVVIGPEDESWHNTLKICDGTAKIIESDCDNQICVATPALQEDIVGLIVCLPHGVVVELR